MKVLVVTQFYYPERFSTSDIAEGLLKEGHDVTVLTGKPNYGYGRILEEYKHTRYEVINGVKVHRVNLRARKQSRLSVIRNYLSFHRNAKRYVKKLDDDFDVVLSISLSPVISIAPAIKYAKKHNVKHVLYCEDLWPESVTIAGAVKKNSLMYKILYKWSVSLYKKCDEIIVSSPSFKDYFVNELHITDKKFVHINQPILNSKNEKIDPIEYKHKHNLVYAGNIGELQNINLLLDAMKLVKSEDTKLYLMGMGQKLNQVKARIKNEHLEDKVEYVGAFPIEKAEEYFVNADALVVSLKNSGVVGKTIPNKAIQYMKYGRPILGVLSGDGKDLLEKVKGSIFAGENAAEIAQTIDELCKKTPSELNALGANNKKYFDENLSSEKLVRQFSNELKESIK